MIKCKKCNDDKNQIKQGFTSAKSQRMLCKVCGCKYTPTTRHISDEKKQLAIKEHYAGASGRAIALIHGFSHPNVYRWIKKNRSGVDK